MNTSELYLITPTTFSLNNFKQLLDKTLNVGSIVAVQLKMENASEQELCRAIETLRPVAQNKNVAFIIEGYPVLAKKFNCDGAHIDMGTMSVETSKFNLGKDLQLGVSCEATRDAAMKAGEQGADYLALNPFSQANNVKDTLELIHWWEEMMELPIVVEGDITPKNCVPFVKAKADFIAVRDTIWNNPEGPCKGIAEMLNAIEKASI